MLLVWHGLEWRLVIGYSLMRHVYYVYSYKDGGYKKLTTTKVKHAAKSFSSFMYSYTYM